MFDTEDDDADGPRRGDECLSRSIRSRSGPPITMLCPPPGPLPPPMPIPFTDIADLLPGGGGCNDDIKGDVVRPLTGLLWYEADDDDDPIPFGNTESVEGGCWPRLRPEEEEVEWCTCPVGVDVRPGPERRGEGEYAGPGGGPDRRCLLVTGDNGRVLGLRQKRISDQ